MNGWEPCPNAHFVDRIPNLFWHFSRFCLIRPISRSEQQRFLSNPYHLIIHLSLYHSTLYSLGTASLNNLKSICKYRMTKYMQQNLVLMNYAVRNCWFTQRCLLLKQMFQLFCTKHAKRTPPWHKSVTLTNATAANHLRLVVLRKNWHHRSWILTPQLLAHTQNCATSKMSLTPAQIASSHTEPARYECNILHNVQCGHQNSD